jgi:flagellar protein FliL
MAKKPKQESADAAGEGAGAPVAAPRPAGRRKIAIAGAAALLLAGGGAGAYSFMAGGSPDAAGAARKPVAFVEIREMTVNLAPEPGEARQRYLKFRVALEVKDPKVISEIQPLLPRVEDMFQVFARELRASDLEGSSGVYRLREELLRRVNIALHPAKVDAVLFKDIVVQ